MTPEQREELLALAAAGSLPSDDLGDFAPVASALFAAVPPINPGIALRARILQRVKDEGLVVQRELPGAWFELGPPGIQMRVLFHDPRTQLKTFLLRMAPGSVLPEHDHAEAEECFIIEGDVETFGTTFRTGDYFRAQAGGHHGLTKTEGGCLMLLTGVVGARS